MTMTVVFTVLKIYGATTLVSVLASVELGAEFFTMVNTIINLVTLVYLQRQHDKVRRIEPAVAHVEQVAATLDTRVPGGRREHDPEGMVDADGR